MSSSSRLVYSTSGNNNCPKCDRPLKKCRCQANKSNPIHSDGPADGIVRLSRETKGRKGKGVTLIKGLDISGEELQKLAKQLKTLCGSGGTIKSGVIEIQGDHRDLIKQKLEQLDFKVKLSGA